jgi:hypothetical protein
MPELISDVEEAAKPGVNGTLPESIKQSYKGKSSRPVGPSPLVCSWADR